MKKIFVTTVLILFFIAPVYAATDDFTADGTITVSAVDFNSTTVNLEILTGSTAESWSYSSGSFTVTNPGSAFKIGSAAAESAVSSIAAYNNSTGTYTACDLNTTPGTSYVTLPSAAATYSIVPSANTDCNSFCASVAHASTYNTFPTCGAATCASGYQVSGSGATATCVSLGAVIPTGGSGGGGGSSQTTCSTVNYDEWQATCASGWQYRNVKSQSPSGCVLTTAQENDKKRQCSTTTTPSETTVTPATPTSAAKQIQNILDDTATIIGGKIENILAAVGAVRNTQAEANASSKYTTPLVSDLKNITAEIKTTITNFINYGTPTTKILGAGERAGVINSYRSAFGKVPSTEAEWSDVIKIGNGRWPTARSATAEAKATTEFKKVYKRSPNMLQANDNAAVTVIAYGLRPANRNLLSEKAAIKSFKAIYGHDPVSATAWDIVRAIAYSGAKR